MIAQAIGAAAQRMLQQDQTAVLVGQTSRGAFLRLDSGEPVFLSLESFRGPLTANIASPAQPLRELPIQAAAVVYSQAIIFEEHGVRIQSAGAETWLAPPRPENTLSEQARRAFGEAVLQQAARQGEPEGMPALVAAALNRGAPTAGIHPLHSSLQSITSHVRQRQPEMAAAAMQPWLGYGRGLTPSGDDLLLGLLLALNRWGDILAPGLDIEAFNRLVLPSASQRTTALSASLIACAAQGQADERLVAALDGLLCGGTPAETLISAIAKWGNSSGLDALAGMLLAIAS
jgi:hypothetical protein